MEHLVVLTGAGVSAESGIATFRDSGGLWEGYDVAEVATPEAWERNPELVLDFYNMRREAAFVAKPNEAHKALVELEKYYNVHVITQNIDNLHEKAGSKMFCICMAKSSSQEAQKIPTLFMISMEPN